MDVVVVELRRPTAGPRRRPTTGLLPVEGPPALVFLLGLAMIGPLFSQSAWNNVTFTGGETRDPGRTLPRALFLGCDQRGRALPAGQPRLPRLAAASTEIQHAPQDRVGHRGDGGGPRPAGAVRDGRRRS